MMSTRKKAMNIEDLALKVEVAKVKHASHYTVNASIEQLQSIADRLSFLLFLLLRLK